MFAAHAAESASLPSLDFAGRLGCGSQAKVYRSQLPGVGAVAVKAFSGVDACSRALGHRESRWLGWLDHPGVPSLYAMYLRDGAPTLVMELFDGVSLHALRQRNHRHPADLPCWLLAHVGRGVSQVLHHCWTHQPEESAAPLRLVHGDLKPGNLMLCNDGRVGVIDFGVATSAHEPVAVRTGAGGTLGYFSPQRMLGAAPTPADDVYALGVALLSTALGGARVGAHPDPQRHERGLKRLLGGLPRAYSSLGPVLQATLCHDPEQRPEPLDLQALLGPFCPPDSLRTWSVRRLVRSEKSRSWHGGQVAWGSAPTVRLQSTAA